MCRGGYWLNEAPQPAAHGASSRPVTPDRTKACLDVSSIDRVTLRQGMSVKLPTQRHSIADRYPSAQPAGGGTDGSSGSPGGSGKAGSSPGRRRSCDLAGGSPSHLSAARSRWSRTALRCRPGRASRAATLIPRTGIARRSSQVDWTMIMSSRLASAAWRGQAARHAEHRYPTGRQCAHQATPSGSRQDGHGA
jgi:hypothetical protein